MTYRTVQPSTQSPDVVVIGAGHAGAEAALAAARAGAQVLVLTPNLDRIGFMPCNPSIGGPAKGHIVAEIDALGGEMARAIDRTALQIRLLNESKGPAVRALRAQADKALYSMAIKEALERQPGVTIRQESAAEVRIVKRCGIPTIHSVRTDFGNSYTCGAVIITAGTFLRGSMVAGDWNAAGGRAGDVTAGALALSIGDVGIRLRRLKTGTPPRIDARSIDFDLTDVEQGSDVPLWFSWDGRRGALERLELPPIDVYPSRTEGWRTQLSCYLVHTNPDGHNIIRANVDRSPMFNGRIEGIGPRYCPSIEDKVFRFAQKDSHSLFLEPEGWRTTEVYVQGANTSLPHDVQLAFLRTIPALRHCSITRFGYAVEYDAIDPTELTPWFAAKRVEGLFLAGQVNGTSGYEEAAGQGLLAGLNAARFVGKEEPVTLSRDQAYIGVMADDLSTQDFVEPYRMLTSRAEHRLLLRTDNANDRLSEIAYECGLITRERRDAVQSERAAIDRLISTLAAVRITPSDAMANRLSAHGLSVPNRPMSGLEYARRPDVHLPRLISALSASPAILDRVDDQAILARCDVEIRYQAYIEKDRSQIERARKMQEMRIPPWLDYAELSGLRNEAREKLLAVRPATLGQAGRIAGVTPSDIAVLIVQLRRDSALPREVAEVE
ncbi:MAG: tRNA uridine-5-carboxymethylaminomethyl(34) synthesis enzyme MnmG [Chloroflexi bacterium]|nr:MAG: tRNA uridine-5-carboxymethylaminomethyl(34) synthesis enzyme MnmG [Chloroflexota bacterium]